MRVIQETYRSPKKKANKIFQIVLTNAIIHPWAVMIKLGYASITFLTMLRAKRLSYYARSAKAVQFEFVLLNELNYCLFNLKKKRKKNK
jgi:hypothetical protein